MLEVDNFEVILLITAVLVAVTTPIIAVVAILSVLVAIVVRVAAFYTLRPILYHFTIAHCIMLSNFIEIISVVILQLI